MMNDTRRSYLFLFINSKESISTQKTYGCCCCCCSCHFLKIYRLLRRDFPFIFWRLRCMIGCMCVEHLVQYFINSTFLANEVADHHQCNGIHCWLPLSEWTSKDWYGPPRDRTSSGNLSQLRRSWSLLQFWYKTKQITRDMHNRWKFIAVAVLIQY